MSRRVKDDARDGRPGAAAKGDQAGLITASRVIWLITLTLFVVWLVAVMAGKGGFIHILILCAVSMAFVQWTADRRASQG